jgi:D-alanyl-D-alanine carboxypeptidase
MRRLRHSKLIAVAGAAVLWANSVGQPSAAIAHVATPTVTALHAFIGDPLFGLDTTEGTLFGILPDERTAQASTTKLMTLHLTVLALNDGVVQLSDQVTINAVEAGIGGSSMQDVNGVALEEDEVVSLETLIRGMMYPSGNNAAWAIGRHVAEGYLGAGADAADFVAMMNAHAAADGLVDTAFTNPNGFDDPFQSGVTPAPDEYNHYTTARELAENMAHAIQDPYFQEVVGFQGTYTDTTTAPSGTKTYSWSWGFGYPGWEGAKGGGTQNCNGPNGGCMAMSAERMGRRVVLAFMQGLPWTEEPGMFDFGFASIFHPDPRGLSSWPAATDDHDIACLPDGRAVSAFLPTDGNARLVSWEPDLDASTITALADATLPKSETPPKNGKGQGPPADVAVAELSSDDLVVAFRKGASVRLSRWSIAVDGTLTLLSDKTKAGPAASMDLQAIGGDTFLTTFADPDGVLVVKSWRLDPAGGIIKLDTYRDESRAYQQVAASGPMTTDVYSGHDAATVSVAEGALVHHVWDVDPSTGAITRLGETFESTSTTNVAIAPLAVEAVIDGELFPPIYYATASWTDGGTTAIRFYRVNSSGTAVLEGVMAPSASNAYDVGVASLGVSGIIQSVRDGGSGQLELTVIEAARNGDNSITADAVAEHTGPAVAAPDICRVPSTHAEGDYVVASLDPVISQLSLAGYRSGDRPF